MIAHFGIRALALLVPTPTEAPPPPPPVAVVSYVGTSADGTFDGGTAPDMTLATGPEDAVTVDGGDGTFVTDAPHPTYDEVWEDYLIEAKPFLAAAYDR